MIGIWEAKLVLAVSKEGYFPRLLSDTEAILTTERLPKSSFRHLLDVVVASVHASIPAVWSWNYYWSNPNMMCRMNTGCAMMASVCL